MKDDSVKSMNKSIFEANRGPDSRPRFFVLKVKIGLKIMQIFNQVMFLQEMNAFNSDLFFDAESVHFTDTTKYVDPTSYADVSF